MDFDVLNRKTNKTDFITFGKPDISEHEIKAVIDVMQSGWIGTGKVSSELERLFSKFMGGGESVAVSSCSIGLIIALKSLGIGHGDEVITTPMTFAATINAIIHAGAKPVFVDVDDNGNINPSEIEYAILSSKKVKAILPVHYCGMPCDMARIMDMAKKNRLHVVEDAAHGFGGFYMEQNGDEHRVKKLGSIGDIGVFSFYSTKNITSGEGGVVYTKNKDLSAQIRLLTNQGQTSGAWKRYSEGPITSYKVVNTGYKGNLPDILAAIGVTQLKRWPELRLKRDLIFSMYEKEFGYKPVGHSHHLYTILVKNRDYLREVLYTMGIGTGIHYEALHLEPAYRYLGYKQGHFPNAEKIGSETLSLPISTTMSVEDALKTIQAVKKYGEGIND